MTRMIVEYRKQGSSYSGEVMTEQEYEELKNDSEVTIVSCFRATEAKIEKTS